ncbi:MAG: twin-arginine translocase TatA/TatE family subunit [Beijerinckiaceae bacterium]
MGSMSIWHWLVVGGIALLLFGGKGKISDIMGDVAKGIKSFKKGMQDEPEETAKADAKPATIEQQAAAKVAEEQPQSQKAG